MSTLQNLKENEAQMIKEMNGKPPYKSALVLIDLQISYLAGEGLDSMVDSNIALKNLFNRHGFKTVVVYIDEDSDTGIEKYQSGLYRPEIGENSLLIGKKTSSAFRSSDIAEILKRHKVENLFITGVNFSSCAGNTALDAVSEGFRTWIVVDCSGNGRIDTRLPDTGEFAKKLTDKGVKFITATALEEAIAPSI